MIIDELVLHNFGAYKGRHSVALNPPSPSKPIVLFGGLNGAGKTTLLDALQLALYGKQARCSNRGSLSYETFLSRCINRTVDASEGAAVELQFRHNAGGKEQVYRLQRSWVQNGNGPKETLEVLVNGRFDRAVSESWPEFAEAFIPSRLSHLFFFDGDKIESLTDIENAAEWLSSAVNSLLGLDLVERLANDLVILERRKAIPLRSQDDRQQIEVIQKELARLSGTRDELVQQCASAHNVVEQRQKTLRRAETALSSEGGDLIAQKSALETERTGLAGRQRSLEDQLREMASGPMPLLAVTSLLEGIRGKAPRERAHLQAQLLATTLVERDHRTLEFLRGAHISRSIVDRLANFFEQDRGACGAAADEPRYLELDPPTEQLLYHLHELLLPDALRTFSGLSEELEEIESELIVVERKLAAVPDEASLTQLIGQRKAAQEALAQAHSAVARLDAHLSLIRRDIEQREAELGALLETEVRAQLEHEDLQRHSLHSQRVRSTLGSFRAAIVRKHIQTLESLITDSFRQLLRKQSLIANIRIDPDQFTVTLIGNDQRVILAERLSAGERQLLAISMLWGLARASGRALPTAIDTPLGRLDTSHRTHLVERYFPRASHQVLLFSTDEEIRGGYLERLAPAIGRSYRLVFDSATEATHIESGYLEGC